MKWDAVVMVFQEVTGLDIDLKSDGNEVAVESIEIAHEGLTIASN